MPIDTVQCEYLVIIKPLITIFSRSGRSCDFIIVILSESSLACMRPKYHRRMHIHSLLLPLCELMPCTALEVLQFSICFMLGASAQCQWCLGGVTSRPQSR